MTSLKILDIKSFMSKLLIKETFDHFLLLEAGITTFNSFFIDGHLHKDYYSKEELECKHLTESPLSYWSQLRPFCFELIKGKRTPLSFKIVFQLSADNTGKLMAQVGQSYSVSDINGFFLTLKYDEKGLSCTTGTSIKIFTLDKSLENVWDEMMREFMIRNEIPFE